MNKLEAIEILKREQNGRRKPQDTPLFKFPEELRKNKELLLDAAKTDKRALYWTSDENLKKDKKFLTEYVKSGGSIYSASPEIKEDEEFMQELEECMKEKNQHSIVEIEETIIDRTSENIDRVSNEITSEVRENQDKDVETNR